MKKILTAFLVISTSSCFSQTALQYANFIQTDTSVKWAAVYNSYINLTSANPNFNIRNFYLKKLEAGNVKAYRVNSLMLSVTPYDLNYNSIGQNKKAVNYDEIKMNWRFNYDNKSDGFENLFKEDSNTCEACLTKNKLSFFKVKQLFYYKNNQLKIQNILLSPVLYKKEILDNKEDVQYFEIANVAFNAIENDSINIPLTAIFITRACNDISLLPETQDHISKSKILTLDNWSLGNILVHDLLKKKLTAYNADLLPYAESANILLYNKILTYHLKPIRVNIYDAGGIPGAIAYRTVMPEVNFDSLYNFRVIQDLYFDFTNEKLYSKLIAFIPRMKIITSSGVDLGFANHWGIMFPEEKKIVITKKK